jgi:hypothetical protein
MTYCIVMEKSPGIAEVRCNVHIGRKITGLPIVIAVCLYQWIWVGAAPGFDSGVAIKKEDTHLNTLLKFTCLISTHSR